MIATFGFKQKSFQKNQCSKPEYATTSFADDTRGGTMSTGAVISRKQKAAFQSECTSLLGHRACGQKSPDCLTATPRAPPPDSSLPLGPSSVVSSRKAAGQDIIPCYRHALVGSPQFSSLSLYVAPLQA
jgi:hypothetical protein